MEKPSRQVENRPRGTSGPREQRISLPLRTLIPWLLLASGLVLLAIYVGARIHEGILSRAAVRQFEELKHTAPRIEASGHAAHPEVPSTSFPPDFFLWSKARVAGFQESLKLRLPPPLGILRIPKLHLEVPLLEGTDDVTLNRGVGWIAGTGRPGENGNIGIAGHRDGFFRGLKDIKVGDRLELEGLERIDTYVVGQLEIVSPRDVSVLRPRRQPSVTLVTCYPFYFIGSAPQRYIVHASRLDAGPPQERATR